MICENGFFATNAGRQAGGRAGGRKGVQVGGLDRVVLVVALIFYFFCWEVIALSPHNAGHEPCGYLVIWLHKVLDRFVDGYNVCVLV